VLQDAEDQDTRSNCQLFLCVLNSMPYFT